MKRGFIFMALALSMVFGGLLAWNLVRERLRSEYVDEHRPGPKSVTVTAVKERPWRTMLRAAGTLQAVERVQVTSPLGGKVTQIWFEDGQDVEQEELLVVLDDSVKREQLAQALAERDAARETVQQYASLLEKGAISQQHYDSLEAKYAQSRAQVEQAKAALGQVRISAPFAGQIGARQVRMGQVLKPGDQVATLETRGIVHCDFSLPIADRSKVFVGQEVELSTDALPGQAFVGKLTAIDPGPDTTRRDFSLRASFPNEAGKLASGAFARVQLLSAEEDEAIAIPRTAITYTLEGDTVFVLDIDSQQERDGEQAFQVKKVLVTPGRERDELVVINTGLQAGEKLVTSGQLKLEDGDWVIPQPSEPPLD